MWNGYVQLQYVSQTLPKSKWLYLRAYFPLLDVGEVHEEQAWSCHGGDGRLLCGGSCHLTSQQQLPVQSEAQRVVRFDCRFLSFFILQ